MHEPFIYTITDAVVDTMGKVFPEIVEKREHVKQVIRSEEESFGVTLDRGLEIFSSVLERMGTSTVFPADDAFRLYDTYGFPFDLTRMMADERGLQLDEATFAVLMDEQKKRARDASKMDSTGDTRVIARHIGEFPESRFVGYDTVETEAVVAKVLDGKFLSLDRTPFYVASGGQVDDIGLIQGGRFTAEVIESYRQDKRIVHEVRFVRGTPADAASAPVRVYVDRQRRTDIQRNHSATHLVHEALRRVLGEHVHQQGSLVAPDRLRFDFPHFGKITPEEITAIEEMVNGEDRRAAPGPLPKPTFPSNRQRRYRT